MKKTIQDAIKLMTYQMRTLRINHHMTQKQMASVLNVSAQSISAYENGVIRPDIEVIMKYAEYFKVDIAYLMGINLYGAIHDVLPMLNSRKSQGESLDNMTILKNISKVLTQTKELNP